MALGLLVVACSGDGGSTEAETPTATACHPAYVGVCLDPDAEDYDCAGGTGNGPLYVEGPFEVVGDDEFGLDTDDDGVGCGSPPPAGALEIHHIDVEQGEGALIISPGGETAMIDNGNFRRCSNTVDYLQAKGITSIDYHFASHYHADHIGCLDDMAAAGIPVTEACYDRGGSYTTATYRDYVATCGELRQTLSAGQVITLDAGTTNPVMLTVIALGGAGVSTSGEDTLSVVILLSYGDFDEVFSGDLPGESPDVESTVGPLVGDVEVYKVGHHGSASSSHDAWLDAISPEVAIISVGSNTFGHPTADVLVRLHAHDVQTYWTNLGDGVSPDPAFDAVGGPIVIEVLPTTYSVSWGDGFVDTYEIDTGGLALFPDSLVEQIGLGFLGVAALALLWRGFDLPIKTAG